MDKETMDIIQSVPKEVWLKLYNDTTHPMLRQFGRLGEDLAKTLRLITLPIQCTAYIQDRVDRGFAKALSDVPEERRVMPPEGMALDIAEKLKHHPIESLLGKLYVDLLTASMDKDRSQQAHPAFLPIIGQLSSDEAFFLRRLSESEPSSYIRPKEGWDILTKEQRDKEFGNATFPIDDKELELSCMLINPEEFYYPQNFYIYIDHLNKLGLLEYTNDYFNKHTDRWRKLRTGELEFFFIRLSKFGRLFYSCCTNGLAQAKF
ncbi:DUF4393 domain-containing protein [Citrobacter braakii]|uniref:DUF4393 domain-containing protein n=1 Tax=Citrobacter braakii TaxID=57706 RepID=UPI0019071051|nr:DUF4393 domain-containing protein [Citrobacter braakii]EGT0622072.1 DUF4393 domain-containing protein [Citrobacter braakii]MBJ8846388.1 DUF4393 domain-containing protein [Citrobacter braakii]